MRILKLFFRAVLVVGIVGSLVGLMVREILLYTAVNQVRSAARELRSLESGADFSKTCLEYAGLPADGQSLTQVQLRFTSDKDYVIETTCQGSEAIRETFREGTLPPLVTKVPGYSGLASGGVAHGVLLGILGRTAVVYESDNFIRSALSYSQDVQLVTDGPTTTCEGYGYQCCNQEYQLGQGEQTTEAWDCPLSCHSQCAERPVVLSFNSDPAVAGEARVVSVTAGEVIEFFYTLNDIQGDAFARAAYAADEAVELKWDERLLRIISQWSGSSEPQDVMERIVINFGDGNSQQVSDLQGSVSHSYSCSRSLCVYNATVQGVTAAGLTSALDDVSKLQVQVKP